MIKNEYSGHVEVMAFGHTPFVPPSSFIKERLSTPKKRRRKGSEVAVVLGVRDSTSQAWTSLMSKTFEGVNIQFVPPLHKAIGISLHNSVEVMPAVVQYWKSIFAVKKSDPEFNDLKELFDKERLTVIVYRQRKGSAPHLHSFISGYRLGTPHLLSFSLEDSLEIDNTPPGYDSYQDLLPEGGSELWEVLDLRPLFTRVDVHSGPDSSVGVLYSKELKVLIVPSLVYFLGWKYINLKNFKEAGSGKQWARNFCEAILKESTTEFIKTSEFFMSRDNVFGVRITTGVSQHSLNELEQSIRQLYDRYNQLRMVHNKFHRNGTSLEVESISRVPARFVKWVEKQVEAKRLAVNVLYNSPGSSEVLGIMDVDPSKEGIQPIGYNLVLDLGPVYIMRGVYMGDFSVSLTFSWPMKAENPERRSKVYNSIVFFRYKTPPNLDDPALLHPHILHSTGSPCLGSFDSRIKQAMINWDFDKVEFILKSFMMTYDINTCYGDSTLGHWFKDLDLEALGLEEIPTLISNGIPVGTRNAELPGEVDPLELKFLYSNLKIEMDSLRKEMKALLEPHAVLLNPPTSFYNLEDQGY